MGALRAAYCVDCGYSHLVPKPTRTALDTFYRLEYYQHVHRGRKRKECREWGYWQQVYKDRLDRISAYRPDAWRLIDVGSGLGWFLTAAREAGWMAHGVEPSKMARSLTRDKGFEVNVLIDDFCLEYDAIHCCLVLEHVLDPLCLLRQMRSRLKDGGILCVVVPNEYNPLQVQMIERFGYSPVHREHVNYFTKSSIVGLVERAGFKVKDIGATFPMEWFALHTPLNYVKWPWTGAVAHWVRMAFEVVWRRLGWWDALEQRWSEKGIGREVVVWAVKDAGNSRR